MTDLEREEFRAKIAMLYAGKEELRHIAHMLLNKQEELRDRVRALEAENKALRMQLPVVGPGWAQRKLRKVIEWWRN